MHSWLLVSKYTSIKRLLYSILLNAVSTYTQKPKQQSIEVKKNLLYKGRDNRKIFYISGVAQHLSKSHNSMTMEIANGIGTQLSATSGEVVNVKIVPPGLIYLELTHPCLATWLQNLAIACAIQDEKMEISENTNQKPNSKNQNLLNLFAVQYAHARCFSLLRLAHQEGLIKLKEVPINGLEVWQLEFPQPIPWLNNDNQLRLYHPTEGYLIAQLVQIVDDLVCSDVSETINWQKAALGLSRAFENFWSQCRIWDEIKTTSPELAQARLGLVMATGRLLQVLLLEKLGSFAPLEL
ncbi:glutamate acetyltransferase [Nostoc sp. FACHB-152]|nr:glutamate acetyltransferase [Nostoc sp. FACHB-152]MBD2468126.1 glutamate acetyltransferase [Nostoc sp. FACHB-145]